MKLFEVFGQVHTVLLNQVFGERGIVAKDLLAAEPALCFHRVVGCHLAVRRLMYPDPASVLGPKIAFGAMVAVG